MTVTTIDGAAVETGSWRSRGAIVATTGAVFMAGLDNLVVTIALPHIRADLGIGIDDLTWTVNAYTLTYAVFMLGAAVLGDRLGRRRVFRFGLMLFVVGSFGCGVLGTSLLSLGGFRAIQGLGAAVLMPLSLTLALEHTLPTERRMTIAIWSAMYGLSTAIGPFVGGAIVEYAQWQWIFLVNLPIGALLLVASGRYLTRSEVYVKRSIDVGSLALLSFGLFGIVLAVMRVGVAGWLSGTSVPMVLGGLAVLGLFFIRQRRSPDPILPPSLFATRGFASSTVTAFFVSAGIYGIIFLLTQYLQVVLGYEPLAAGVSTLPWTIVPVAVAPLSVVASRRLGVRPLMIAGVVLMAAALGWFGLVIDPAVRYPMLLPGLLLGGLGMGVFFALVAAQALSFVPEELDGLASGVNNSVRQVGIVSGVAVITIVFTSFGGRPTKHGFDVGIEPAIWLAVALLAVAALSAVRTPESPR